MLKDGTPVKVSQARSSGSRELPRGTEVFVVLPAEQCQVFVDGSAPRSVSQNHLQGNRPKLSDTSTSRSDR